MMLTDDKVTAIFCFVDDFLKAIGHREDGRRRVWDSEVITTALVSALYFGGHHGNAIGFMKTTGLVPNMLSKSRFSRRIHAVLALESKYRFYIFAKKRTWIVQNVRVPTGSEMGL